jgi:hypothetical protein
VRARQAHGDDGSTDVMPIAQPLTTVRLRLPPVTGTVRPQLAAGVISATITACLSRPPPSLGAQHHPIRVAYDVLIWRCSSSCLVDC